MLPPASSLLAAVGGSADPAIGAVFREYLWTPAGKFARITGENPRAEPARAFLPNPILRLDIDDLAAAVRAEVGVELLQSHPGTRHKRVRLNGGPWHPIPEPSAIPGGYGAEPGPPERWNYHIYPTVPVPLSELRLGTNTIEFAVDAATDPRSLGGWWPQSIHYAVTVRVHYDARTKPHRRGRIVSPENAGELAPQAPLALAIAGEDPIPIGRVEFLAECLDYDWAGDGSWRAWQGHPRHGRLQHHAGTAEAPGADGLWTAVWDTAWLPDQAMPMRLTARVVDATGLVSLAPLVEGLSLAPRPWTVTQYRASGVPPHWQSRAQAAHGCCFHLSGSAVSDAQAARLWLPTWNGVQCDRIAWNETTVAARVGADHDLSYDTIELPPALLRAGFNSFHTWSETDHHGIEVLWPGPVLRVRRPAPSHTPPPA